MKRYDQHIVAAASLILLAGVVMFAGRQFRTPEPVGVRGRVEYPSQPGAVSYDEGSSNFPEMYREAAELTDQGKSNEAEEVYRKIIELEPNSALGYIGLGSCRFEQHDLKGAEENYRRAAALDPKSSMATLGLGSVCRRRNEFQAAIEFYTRALALAPGLPDAHWGLAITYDDIGNRQQAGYHFREFWKLAPDSLLAPRAKSKLVKYEARPDPGFDPENSTAK